jgi:hypothetical protein
MDRRRIASPRGQSRDDQWNRLIIQELQVIADSGSASSAEIIDALSNLALEVTTENIDLNVKDLEDLLRGNIPGPLIDIESHLKPGSLSWSTSIVTTSGSTPVAESLSVENSGTINVTFNGVTMSPGQIWEASANFKGDTIQAVPYIIPAVPPGGELTIQSLS